MNSRKYIDILSDFAVPYLKNKFDKNYILQQDNCPAHDSRKKNELHKQNRKNTKN